MAIKDTTDTKSNRWISSALKVNLERTAAVVEIPGRYAPLVRVVESHYGLKKKVLELLTELNHPFVNWEYVLKELKSISIGDFYIYNSHEEGLTAISLFVQMYFDAISEPVSGDIRDAAIRYIFDFIDTILSQSRELLSRNLSLFPGIIDSLLCAAKKDPALFKKASSYLKRTIKNAAEAGAGIDVAMFDQLLYTAFQATYNYWLGQPDPSGWFTGAEGETAESTGAYGQFVEPLTHEHLQALLGELHPPVPGRKRRGKEYAQCFPEMPDYFQIVNGYLLVADQLEKSPAHFGRQHLVLLDFLFRIMGVPGLADIHGSALREINRCLKMVFREEKKENLNDFVRRIFGFLKKSSLQHELRGTIIDCITTTAREVFEQNAHSLVDTFIDELIAYGFQHPDIKGATAEWQVQVNPVHIVNIRSWLSIIAMKPRWTKRLISALIVNLKVGGVFIRDTDLIQKDISALLNCDIAPAYNLIKQLLRIFPVYFTEIGAEGELREISSKVDELSFRNDKLVFFLRKQSHVESNSLLVEFIAGIFRYWLSGDKENIRKHIPDEVYEQVVNSGEYFDGMHAAFVHLLTRVNNDHFQFLEWDRARVYKELLRVHDVNERDRERTWLMIRLFQLLYKKYYPRYIDLLADMEDSHVFPKTEIAALRRALRSRNHFKSLTIILKFLSVLKDKILSDRKTVSYENIYYKRHIAAGIPSMYGTYHEEKFEALGLSLRLESLAAMLFEELIRTLNLKFITKRTITKIHACLWLFIKALELEGISAEGLVSKVKYITSALTVKQFSLDQYIDIFRFISKSIQDIIRDYYIDAHSSNLPVVIRQVTKPEGQQEKGPEPQRQEEIIYQYSENFIRGMISSAFGLQVLDNFVHAVTGTLNAEQEKFKDKKEILKLVMSYNPELVISPIYKKNKRLDNQILLGNKGYFLKELVSFGFRVPPGFILTTEVFRCYAAVYGYKYIFNDLASRVNREMAALEKMTGRKFGNRVNPLLLSVRSGATVSLPGMMQSFLNVGINSSIARELGKKEEFRWAAWDCYRRFLQTWGMFQGLDRNVFDVIMESFKKKYNVAKKIRFLPGQMKLLALAYRQELADKGIKLTDDPLEQLRDAIQKVFESWNSDQARIYRRQMNISDEWGTAVVVQAMVFGNLNEQSGSGVIFTRDPKGSSTAVALYGDFIFGVQGHDIVSGLVETYPISERQRLTEHRDQEISLEEKFPEIYNELVRLAEILIYEKGYNHQEIEFTFEGPAVDNLYILQTRDMGRIGSKRLRRFKDAPGLAHAKLGTGVGVSGGALCGRAVYSEADINRFRKTEPRTPLILLRPDTVPDDVGVLLQVDGLLTAKGGATSHAAVTIPQLNKTGVVGMAKLKVYEADGLATIAGMTIRAGDFIGIDGWTGAVYSGKHEREAEKHYHITL
jgi:pyruvate, orthophosphate dikinase